MVKLSQQPYNSKFIIPTRFYHILVYVFTCLATSIGFGVVMGLRFLQTFKLLLWVVFIDCIAVGMVIATLMW